MVNPKIENTTVAVVGLGYVGLPLALAFGRKLNSIGFDLNQEKLHFYRDRTDPTGEMDSDSFHSATKLKFTPDPKEIKLADFVVVAVPTPVDGARRPDFKPLEGASRTVGDNLKPGAVVIYESTVYPGATEEVCLPILEKHSGLKAGRDFFVGYSPERVNPGDKLHRLEKIVKVVAGQDAETLEKVAWLYGQVIEAGVFKASSIAVAEAAKVIENTQRDLNIALMNELAIIFHKVGIDTQDVLQAAGTKWNFLKFVPGLVGGHCIGVDPYYLTHKAEALGYNPQVILAGRRINDSMGAFIAQETVKEMLRLGKEIKGATVLIMGLTFKENISDLRNSKVIDIINELKSYGVNIKVWDPVVYPAEAREEYGLDITPISELEQVDAVVAAVTHREILNLDLSIFAKITKGTTPFIDVKSAYDKAKLKVHGFSPWRL